jgi:hypothetical protein
MLPLMKTMLLAIILSGSPEPLPTLQSVQPEQLPSINSVKPDIIPVTDRMFSATCYLGNPNDRQTLGDLTVNGAEAAGPACNAMFFVCKGRCYGCFSDFDYSQDICVDNSGKKFLR